MTDRRTEDTQPIAPPRSLSGPTATATGAQGEARKPLSERVSATIASTAQSTKPSQVRPPQTSARPLGAPVPTSLPAAGPAKVRKARLRLTHVDPWSVMKMAFLLSVAIGVVTVVAVAVVWGVLGVAGVWESINKTVVDVIGGDTADTFDIRDYLGTSRVMGFTMIVAVVDVVLITALATLGAFLYNLAAALLGGLEVTLAEDDH
jgi:hypothetical protein